VDPGGMSLPTLTAKLKQEFNPDKPVNIQTMAFGKDADVAALRQISAATGGATWVVRNPTDLRSVLLKVLLTKP
jgi:Ca-activated chloride channel family protein